VRSERKSFGKILFAFFPKYEKVKVLGRVSFSVEKKGVVVFLGPNDARETMLTRYSAE